MLALTSLSISAAQTVTRRSLSGSYQEQVFTVSFTAENQGTAPLFVIENMRRLEFDEDTNLLTLWYGEPAPDPAENFYHSAAPTTEQLAAGASRTFEKELLLTQDWAMHDAAGDLLSGTVNFGPLTQVEIRIRSHTSDLDSTDFEDGTGIELDGLIAAWGAETVRRFNHTIPPIIS